MSKFPECYGIIPVRYDSTRFPGKPLAEILGKPMFWHVFHQAKKCSQLSQVLLATDDSRIFSAAELLNIPVVMTCKDHPSGTDRVLEAAQLLKVPEDAVVVNIQGDEPALEPDMLTQLIGPFINTHVQVTTLARKINIQEAKNPDRVKVVFTTSGRALYFSRSLIPYSRKARENTLFGHIGLYAFRMKILKQFVTLGPSRLETAERLEQLRLIENEIPVHVVVTDHQSIGVDRPEDLETINRILKNRLA